MNGNDLKKRIASVGLAAVIGATSGIALEKGLNNKDNSYKSGKRNKEVTVVWNNDDIKDYSFILGGLLGHYDFLNGNGEDYTKNDCYEKYNEYLDLLEYISGYQEGYQKEGVFISYEDKEYTLEELNAVANVFETMANGSVKKQYVTTDPDKVLEVLHPEDYGKTRS